GVLTRKSLPLTTAMRPSMNWNTPTTSMIVAANVLARAAQSVRARRVGAVGVAPAMAFSVRLVVPGCGWFWRFLRQVWGRSGGAVGGDLRRRPLRGAPRGRGPRPGWP